MDKEIKTFTNITGGNNSNKGSSADKKEKSKEIKRVTNDNFIHHKIEGNVTLTVVKDSEEDYTKIVTLEDVINLDRRKPSNIVSISPPLYHELIDKAKKCIKIHAEVGAMVKVKRKFMDKKGDIPRRVDKLHLQALNDMTIIVATLEDGDYQLSHRLEVCN